MHNYSVVISTRITSKEDKKLRDIEIKHKRQRAWILRMILSSYLNKEGDKNDR